MCVLLGFLQKTLAIPIMNPLSWFMLATLSYIGITDQYRIGFKMINLISDRYQIGLVFLYRYASNSNPLTATATIWWHSIITYQ